MVLDAILTGRPHCQKLQCLYGSLMTNNFEMLPGGRKIDSSKFKGCGWDRRRLVTFIYLEQFESRTLGITPTLQLMWCRYVDDAMTRNHEYAVNFFL